MNSTAPDRFDKVNREAERARTSGDPRPTDARDAKPLVLMMAAALVATTLVLGMMWMSGMRYDGPNPRAVAEQRQ